MDLRRLLPPLFAFALALPAAAGPSTPGRLPPPKQPRPRNLPAKPGMISPTQAPTGAALSEAEPLSLAIETVTLENGLRVVMNVDKTSPTVAVAVTYDVGSRDEERGRSGFAHLFEHMMFQGSQSVPKGEHFKLIVAHGGTLNGTTSTCRTNYYQVLPSSELGLALYLEADRMRSLDVSLENFENQRKVVQEEYRMRVSNQAYADARIRLSELAYEGYWPYEHSTIGSMQDLDDAKLEWVREFYEEHYAPNLAVLSIAGDFEPDEALALVRRYFDPAKKSEPKKPYDPPPLPPITSPRTAAVDDPNAKTPGLFLGWVIPPMRDVAHYPLELAAAILGDGESSRLYQRLVREKGWATQAWAGTYDRRGPDLFTIFVKLTEGADVDAVEKLVLEEIGALATRGPTELEMKKVRNRTEASFLFGLQSNLQRAIRLGESELYFGDARSLTTEPLRYAAVQESEIRSALASFVSPEKRAVVVARPAAPTETGAR